jgi:drug/metabolite transporter (DMT)-like permease
VSKADSSPTLAGRQIHAPVVATLLVLATYFVWMVHDTIIKLLTSGYAIPQIIFFGRALAVPISFFLTTKRVGLGGLRSHRIGSHFLRALSSLADIVFFVSAIALTSLANTTTITFSAPLIMTILSAVFLHENVGWRRWTAVVMGFLGVLIVLQPSGAGLGVASIFAIGSAVAYAIFLILTRAMTRHEPVPVMILWNSGLVMIFMGIWMIPVWRTPTPEDWVRFIAIAVTGAIGQFTTTEAFRMGEASLLAPLQYTSLIWAALFGYVVFDDVPSATLWVGAAVIMMSALYIVLYEHRKRQ